MVFLLFGYGFDILDISDLVLYNGFQFNGYYVF